MTTWFTSDLHLEHKNIITYCERPFTSIDEHDEALITNWNAKVQPDDSIYVLGDFSLSFSAVERYSSQLNGTKYLVPGNHDRAHPLHRNHRRNTDMAYAQFGWHVLPCVFGVPRFALCHFPFALCHFPYSASLGVYHTTDCRFPHSTSPGIRYRTTDCGLPLLCGHVHEKWKTKLGPRGSLMINVGVDQWDYAPVALDTLTELRAQFNNGAARPTILQDGQP